MQWMTDAITILISIVLALFFLYSKELIEDIFLDRKKRNSFLREQQQRIKETHCETQSRSKTTIQ